MKKTIWTLVVVIIIIAGLFFAFYNKGENPSSTATSTPTLLNTVNYSCASGKTITAAYYQGTSTPAVTKGRAAKLPDEASPVPTGSVVLKLSDGRNMTLPQTISADGARYASADGTIVFWSKGDGLTFTENNQQTYSGCIVVAADPGGLPNTYSNATDAFSIRYPANYTVDENYSYQEMGPGKDINGVKFTIDPVIAEGTNLSNDSYVSVEELPKATACSASLFLDAGAGVSTGTLTENGTTYSVASSTGAGAGNRYEEDVYAIPGSSPCVAVRYYIHYGVIENYPPGTVTAFDETTLKAQFDAIRKTLTLN